MFKDGSKSELTINTDKSKKKTMIELMKKLYSVTKTLTVEVEEANAAMEDNKKLKEKIKELETKMEEDRKWFEEELKKKDEEIAAEKKKAADFLDSMGESIIERSKRFRGE